MAQDNQTSLRSNDVEKIIVGAAEAVVEIFKDVRETAGMAADIGCLACMANEEIDLRKARKLREDVFAASEVISSRSVEARNRLREISQRLDHARLHAPNERIQCGIEKASECVSRLLHVTVQMRFFKLIVHNWQAPDLNTAFQAGLEEYDLGQH